MGTPDFNTALQMLADWLVFLEEKKAELRAKMAMTGAADFNAAFKESPADAGSVDAPTEPGDEQALGGASGRVLPFSPFDEDAPAELPDIPIAGPAWTPPAEIKPEAAQMLDDPLGDSDDSPISADFGRRASGLNADGDEDEDFRQAMRPGQARPPVVTPLAPSGPPPRSGGHGQGVLGIDQIDQPPARSGKPPIPTADTLQRSGHPGDSSDPPVLAVEPATNPLDALDTMWGAEAAPGLAKRRRRVLPKLVGDPD